MRRRQPLPRDPPSSPYPLSLKTTPLSASSAFSLQPSASSAVRKADHHRDTETQRGRCFRGRAISRGGWLAPGVLLRGQRAHSVFICALRRRAAHPRLGSPNGRRPAVAGSRGRGRPLREFPTRAGFICTNMHTPPFCNPRKSPLHGVDVRNQVSGIRDQSAADT